VGVATNGDVAVGWSVDLPARMAARLAARGSKQEDSSAEAASGGAPTSSDLDISTSAPALARRRTFDRRSLAPRVARE